MQPATSVSDSGKKPFGRKATGWDTLGAGGLLPGATGRAAPVSRCCRATLRHRLGWRPCRRRAHVYRAASARACALL